MSEQLLSTQCPWYKRNHAGHKGRFGLMGQCLDCMDEIEKGRCAVDVKNFDFDMYWQVKKFWDKVDIKGQDDCWHWLGATKKNESETQAYFPAPFLVVGRTLQLVLRSGHLVVLREKCECFTNRGVQSCVAIHAI